MTKHTQKNIFSFYSLHIGRWCMYILISLILLVLLVFSGLSLFLYKNPEALSNYITTKIKAHTAVEVNFSSVDVTLFPLPALAFSDVTIEYEQLKLDIAYATARPAIWPLFKGNFAIGHASLLRPNISGNIANANKKQESPESSQISTIDYLQNNPILLPIPTMLWGCDLDILNGNVDLIQDNTRIIIENIRADININRHGHTNASINLDSSELIENKSVLIHTNALAFEVDGIQPQGNYDQLTLSLNTKVNIPDALEQVKIDLTCSMQSTGTANENYLTNMLDMLNASLSIEGNIIWHKQAIPFAIMGDLRGHADASLEFINTHVELDRDSLVLNATLNNVFSKSPSLDGHIDLERLSLTQWFGFARNLPPGLQKTLDHITDGELQFSIDENSLKVPHIKASAVDANFTGKGGVSSWKKIIVFLDLIAPDVSLLKAFPETEGVEVTAPSFPYPPLTPIPGSIEAITSSGPTIDYDINIGAKSVTTWDLTVNNVAFKCIPADGPKTNPKNHPNAVLLDIGIGKFYGGRGESKTILFRTEDNRSGYDITAILRNVNAKTPLEILAGREIMGGQLSLDASVLSYGKNLGQFLISKQGEVSLRVDNGYFTSKEKNRTNFTKFDAAGKFDSAPLTRKMVKNMPEILRYNGQWATNLKRSDLLIESNLNGILTFAGRNYTDLIFSNVPSKTVLIIQPELSTLKQELISDINGDLSLNTQKSTTSLSSAHINFRDFANLSLTGDIALNYINDLEWHANLDASTEELSILLAKLSNDGKSPLASTAPQKLRMQSSITSDAKKTQINNLKIELGDMSASGSIHKTLGTKPSYDVKLKFGLLDLDTLFLNPDAKKVKTTNQTKPWSLAWLRDNDASGIIDIEVLRIYKTNATAVHIPISMSDGTLNIKPFVSSFYGGPARINFMGKAVNDALHIQGGVEVDKADMLPLSNDLKLETIIGGKGSIWLSAQGVLTNSNTILPLLDGTWRIKIDNGFFQAKQKEGTVVKQPTMIDEMQDAGPLSNGILYSKNLVIKGPGLNVTGSGKVDLIQSKLDMNLVASMSGINNIKVRYYGNLDDPQRDIHTGSLIVGALSTFGTGIFDIIGGVFDGLFSLLKPKK